MSDVLGPVSVGVAASLAALALPPSDLALAALVRAYAHEIDIAAEREVRFDKLISKLSRDEDPDIYDAIMAARGLLGTRATLDKLGARLQLGLDQLRATPRARPVEPPRAPTGSPLGRLRLAAGTDVDQAFPDGPQS